MNFLQLAYKQNEYRKSILIGLLLFFVGMQSFSFSSVYFNALFLNYYPATWLSYYYFSLVPVSILVIYLLNPFLKRNSCRDNALIMFVTVLGMIAGLVLLSFHFKWFPFIFCIFAEIVQILIIVLSTNAISTVFDIHHYKIFISKFLLAGTIGSMLASFSSSMIAKKFSMDVVLGLEIITASIMIVCLFLLPQRFKGTPALLEAAKKDKISILHYPLAINLLVFGLAEAIIYYGVKYLLSYGVAQDYHGNEIAEILGVVFGAIQLLILFAQLFIVKLLMQYFGVAGLFYITPITALLGMVIFLIQPTLTTIIILNVLFSVAIYSFYENADAVALSVLPTVVRNINRLFAKGVIFPFGKVVIAIIIFIISDRFAPVTSLRIICGFSLVWTLVWLWRVRKISPVYQQALQDGIKNKRFNFIDAVDAQFEAAVANRLALELLQKSDRDSNLIGFSLLHNFTGGQLRPIFLQKLITNDCVLQRAAIRAISKSQDKYYVAALLALLKTTNDVELMSAVVIALQLLDPAATLLAIADWNNAVEPSKKLCWAIIAAASGDKELKQLAYAILLAGLSATDRALRRIAVKSLRNISIEITPQLIRKLLADQDLGVSISTIKLIGKKKLVNYLPELLEQLVLPYKSYYAVKALEQFGDQTIPMLVATIQHGSIFNIEPCIRVIMHLNSKLAIATILDLANSDNAVIKTALAKQAVALLHEVTRAAEFYVVAAKLMTQAAVEAKQLQVVLRADLSGYPKYIHHELKVKLALAKLRCLSWAAIYSNSIAAAKVIPVLATSFNASNDVTRQARAIELFDSVARDGKTRDIINQLVADTDFTDKFPAVALTTMNDPMVKKFLNYFVASQEISMENNDDTMKKVVALRQVNLFATLPGEALYAIAGEATWREMVQGETLFLQGAEPDGLYIIVTGTVKIIRDGVTLSLLKAADYFGEIGLIDNSSRTADAVVAADGMLLYIDKIIFDNIVTDVPDVLRVIAQKIIQYYRSMIH